ncbi:2190_t:CDS:2 [Ambispora gerdemannii]|uniref:2190_t:CDS:1 n=1 Tax=Ambispora gerdemannii TaxID=144530 RepID=A0A9N9BEM2_9GLOM|nr:2190_t:CDS:2 [Ambispora gerdemannii]
MSYMPRFHRTIKEEVEKMRSALASTSSNHTKSAQQSSGTKYTSHRNRMLSSDDRSPTGKENFDPISQSTASTTQPVTGESAEADDNNGSEDSTTKTFTRL